MGKKRSLKDDFLKDDFLREDFENEYEDDGTLEDDGKPYFKTNQIRNALIAILILAIASVAVALSKLGPQFFS